MAARAMPAMRRSWTRWVGGRAAAAKSFVQFAVRSCERDRVASTPWAAGPHERRKSFTNANSQEEHVYVHLKQDRKYDAVQPCEASHPMG